MDAQQTINHMMQEINREMAARMLFDIQNRYRNYPITPPAPKPRPLMVWQRFYAEWLIEQLQAMAQEVHDWAESLGAICNHEECRDW